MKKPCWAFNEGILHIMKKNGKPNYDKNNSKFSKGGEHIAVSSRGYPSDAVETFPLEVKVNGNFDRAFKTFRSLVQKDRILSLYKEKQSFEKKSDKNRRKRAESRRKLYEMEMKRKRFLSGDIDKEKEKKKGRRSGEEPDMPDNDEFLF